MKSRSPVPCVFSFTILADSGMVMKKIAKRAHAGTLCWVALGIATVAVLGLISLKDNSLSLYKPTFYEEWEKKVISDK